jgi:hypothetical protein
MARNATKVPKPKPPRPLIVSTRASRDDAQLYNDCSAGWAGVKADPTHFPSPPGATDMDASLTALGKALTETGTGGTTEKAAVRTEATKVRNVWGQIAKYVEASLRKIAIEETPPILASVKMYRSRAGAHKPKPPLRAAHGATSGSSILVALAIAHALTYTWEWSTDQQTWQSTTTGKARVTINGLTAGKLYWFRVRAFLRDGTTTDWVASVGLMMI